jgi:protein arginine N-methyltransferase 2
MGKTSKGSHKKNYNLTMRKTKMVFSENGIHPVGKPNMFVALNKYHEYYKNVAEILGNGDILEIGFGMGICSNEIQLKNPKSHTIIEINEDIYHRTKNWSKDKKNIKVILGDWKEELPNLRMKYDGIFIDTIEDGNIWNFEKYASIVSKKGTVLSILHYNKLNNKNLFFKEVDGRILNWSIFDGTNFGVNTEKTQLI